MSSEALEVWKRQSGRVPDPEKPFVPAHGQIPFEPARPIEEDEVIVPKLDLHRVLLDGKRVDARVEEAMIDASLERTIEGASTVTFNLNDPERELLNEKVATEAVAVEIHNLRFKLVKVSKVDNVMTLVFEDEAVYWMRQYNKFKKAFRDKVTRAEFAKSLVKEVKEVRIPFYSPELHKEQEIKVPKELRRAPRSRRNNDENRRKRDRKRGVTTGENITIKGAEADGEQIRNINIVMDVGASLGAPRHVHIAAMEAIIVESTAHNLSGGLDDSAGIFQQRPSQGWGTYQQVTNMEYASRQFYTRAINIHKDNPGFKPHRIAFEVQHNYDTATRGLASYGKWVDEAVKIVEAYGAGPYDPIVRGGERYRVKRYAFRRGQNGKRENTWDCLGRLADEVNWRRFMVGKRLFFISEELLIKSQPRFIMNEETEGIDKINFDLDTGKKAATATVTAWFDTWKAPPGSVVKLIDMGPANGRWLVESVRSSFFTPLGEITLRQPRPSLKEPAPEVEVVTRDPANTRPVGPLDRRGGAKGLVDQCVRIAQIAGGDRVYSGSGYREGDRVDSGGYSDHAFNDSHRAARDIGVQGINLITGPPSPQLDRAVVAIGDKFGRDYGNGRKTIVDTFYWHGYRVQIIWRTPDYGGHMGHIHVGIADEVGRARG